MIDCTRFETLRGFWLHHKLESWFPNSRKNVLLNGKKYIRKSVGCVLAELQWLVEMYPIINILSYVLHTHKFIFLLAQ